MSPAWNLERGDRVAAVRAASRAIEILDLRADRRSPSLTLARRIFAELLA